MQGAASEAGPDTGLAMCCGQAGCWTDGDASEAARRVSDFLVGAPRVATRVSEIQYQCEGGPQRNRLVPSASSVSNEVKSLSSPGALEGSSNSVVANNCTPRSYFSVLEAGG